MSSEENINYEEEISNINKKIKEIINVILDGHSFRWLTNKEYSALDEESKNNSNIEYHILDSELIISSDNGRKYKVNISDEGELYTEEIIDIIKVENLVLNSESVILNKGEIYQLEVTVVPDNATNKKVVWESSDSNIVAVSEGKLMAISSGNAIITVTSNDGSISKTCNVVVKKELIRNGLVCYVDANDFSNNKLIDKTGNFNFITSGNPLLKDNYLFFDGIDDLIYVNKISEVTKDCTITISFNEGILGQYSVKEGKQCKVFWSGQDYRGYNALAVFVEKIDSKNYRVRTGQTTIISPKVYYSNYIDNSNSLTCIDIILDVSNKVYKVYKNGMIVGQATIESNLNSTVEFGGIYNGSSYFYSYSNIGSFKVYNRILSEDEIINNYEYEKYMRQ